MRKQYEMIAIFLVILLIHNLIAYPFLILLVGFYTPDEGFLWAWENVKTTSSFLALMILLPLETLAVWWGIHFIHDKFKNTIFESLKLTFARRKLLKKRKKKG